MRKNGLRIGIAIVAVVAAATMVAFDASAFKQKEARDQLDLLVFTDPQLRLVETSIDADELGESLSAINQINAFRAAYGSQWRFTIDFRRGVPSLLSGGAIPFIPGNANELRWEDFGADCRHNSCLPVAAVEQSARAFLASWGSIFGVDPADLVLDLNGSGPFGASIYLLRFQLQAGEVPVERGSIYFRINNGNLIQVATDRIAPVTLDPTPTVGRLNAHAVLDEYLGPFGREFDEVLDEGSLQIIPVTPEGQDPDAFDGDIGSGIDYRLVWRFAFTRPGVIGTWEALVDAHSGELVRFVDSNRYGRIHGGAYPGDGHTGEADRPMAFADTGLPPPNEYADVGGLFPGDNATTTLRGKYTWISDACGAISNTTTTGDVDFSMGTGTDCDNPIPNNGGPGNTHATRTQYYHLTYANIKARTYFPTNNFLNNQHITAEVNGSPLCNAFSGGLTVSFFRGVTNSCWNLGEIPGVSVHEWGHSMDGFDGSGGGSPPIEAYADWAAALHLRDSCVGDGFFLSGNCGGYGDPCTDCSGIRDVDYMKHLGMEPWTAANFGPLWSCGSGNYQGPCNVSDHCESGIASQALWDMATRDFTAAPFNLDQRTAWLLADRLFWLATPTMGNMYNCSIPNSDGCAGSSLYNTLLAIDDDGDGAGNGTPHASAIFAAMDRHNIACGSALPDQSSCPSLEAPTVSGEGGNNSAELSWTAVTNATRYKVFRNDIDCDASYALVGEVIAPFTSFTDDTVVNDIIYYYLVQAVTDSDSCAGPVSNCEIVTPVSCITPDPPTALSATAAGDNRIDLSWTSIDPVADSFSVYRSIGSCPGGDYQLIATGVTGTSYQDTTVSGNITYAYVVTASDVTGDCESSSSDCAEAQTSGDCLEPPAFDGLQSVTNAQATTCTLDLAWNAASDYCGGPVSYNVYRSTTQGFIPDDLNRIATGVVGTTYSDDGGVDFNVEQFYIVRSVDEFNGAEDGNLVEHSDKPTGAIVLSFEDDFEGGNQGWVFTDTSSTGDFLIADPIGTSFSGHDSQPEDDHTPGGVNCLYTDENPLGEACCEDIDDGEVVATSPTFDGTGAGTMQLDMWRWFSNRLSDDSGDYYYLEVSNNDGSTWTELENIPGTNTSTNSWTNVSFDLGSFITLTSTMKIRVRAADGSATGDLVELAIDDIVIDSVAECTPGVSPLIFADGFESGDTSVWSLTVE